MEKITYGAPRLVDWVAQIKAGSATIMVHFTGGALTAYGVTPAEYTTTNQFIQRVIENSKYFKEGRIVKLRSTKIQESQKAKDNTKAEDTASVRVASLQQKEASNAKVRVREIDKGEDANGSIFTSVEVSCLPDAQAYLQENFNISSYKIRSCEAAQQAAFEHGVKFTGGKFDTIDIARKSEDAVEK